MKGIDLNKVHDFHVHVVGLGKSNTGIWVNPKIKSRFHLWNYLKFRFYLSASGAKNQKQADDRYVERLLKLLRGGKKYYGKLHLLAFDKYYNQNGVWDKKHTTFYVPNDYVYKLATQYPEFFIPVMSVNPNRKDALEELEKWAKKGVHYLKWLPNAMGIDPINPRHIPFYKMMKRYDVVLLSHTGYEKAVGGEECQELGNPMRLKLPLDIGVKVIMAHIGSSGKCDDLENKGERISCFDAFLKMFNNPKYEKNLWGEISAITLYTKVGKPLNYILNHPEIHHRLVNGSDYPLPAINFLYRTKQFVKLGYITKEERKLINEIYDYNPLLFDFVLKRTLKHPKTKNMLTPEIFEKPANL